MTHKGTVTIETERLILRRFCAEDAEAAFRNWTNEEKVTKYLMWPTHGKIEVTQNVLSDWIARYDDDAYYQWAIVLKELGEPIGSISVVEQDEKAQKFHIGYCIGSRWWHRGIMSEAFSALIAFFFEEVGAGRIEARHDPKNPNSGAVMRKCGLIYEGTLRRSDWNNTGIVDACMYGMLASDYFGTSQPEKSAE